MTLISAGGWCVPTEHVCDLATNDICWDVINIERVAKAFETGIVRPRVQHTLDDWLPEIKMTRGGFDFAALEPNVLDVRPTAKTLRLRRFRRGH